RAPYAARRIAKSIATGSVRKAIVPQGERKCREHHAGNDLQRRTRRRREMDSNHRFPVTIGQERTPEWRSLRRKYLHSLGLGVLLNAGLSRGTDGSNPSPSSRESVSRRNLPD